MEQTYRGYRVQKKISGKPGGSHYLLKIKDTLGKEYKQLSLQGAWSTIQNWVTVEPNSGRIVNLLEFPQKIPANLTMGEINCWYYLRSWKLLQQHSQLQQYIEGFSDIRIYDYAGEWILIIQPWSSAQSIQDISRETSFRLEQFLSVYLRFLEDFHQAGLCIYDISAGNILFDFQRLQRGEKDACRLIDYEFLMHIGELRSVHNYIHPHYLKSAAQLNGIQYFPDALDQYQPAHTIDAYLDYRLSFMMLKNVLGKKFKTSQYKKTIAVPFDETKELAYRESIIQVLRQQSPEKKKPASYREPSVPTESSIDIVKQESAPPKPVTKQFSTGTEAASNPQVAAGSNWQEKLQKMVLPEPKATHYIGIAAVLILIIAALTYIVNIRPHMTLHKYQKGAPDERTIESAPLEFDELMDIYQLNPEKAKFKDLSSNTHRKVRRFLDQQKALKLTDEEKLTLESQIIYWQGKAPKNLSGCAITGKLTWDKSDFSSCSEQKKQALKLYKDNPETENRYVLLAYSLWGTADCIEKATRENCLEPIAVSKKLFSNDSYPTWMRIEGALNYALTHSWLVDEFVQVPLDDYRSGCGKLLLELQEYYPYENLRLATSRCLKASLDYQTWIEWAEIYRDFYHPSILKEARSRSKIRSKLMMGIPNRNCRKQPYRDEAQLNALEEQSFCSWAADSILNGELSEMPDTLGVPWFLLLFQESDDDKYGWLRMEKELQTKGYSQKE